MVPARSQVRWHGISESRYSVPGETKTGMQARAKVFESD